MEKEKKPFAVIVRKVDDNSVIIFRNVVELESLENCWKLKLIDKKKPKYDEKGRLSRVITTESTACIDNKEADLIDIQTAIEEIEKLCCPDFVPEWYEKAFEDIKDTVIETIRGLSKRGS